MITAGGILMSDFLSENRVVTALFLSAFFSVIFIVSTDSGL